MQYGINDILDIDGILWLSQNVLIDLNIKESYLRETVRKLYKKSVSPLERYLDILPDTGKSWRWAKIEGKFYYDFDRIPDRKPTYYRSQLPPREELERIAEELQNRSKEDAQKLDKARREQAKKQVVKAFDKWIEEYVTEAVGYFQFKSETKKFNISQSHKLCEAWGWLEFLNLHRNDYDSFANWGVKNQKEFYEVTALHLAKQNLEGFSANTEGYVRKRLYEYRKEVFDRIDGYEFVISGKYGNDHARKVGLIPLVHPVTGEELKVDIHEIIIYSLWMNFGKANKITRKDVHEQYIVKLEEYGIPSEEAVSLRTVRHYLGKFTNKVLTAKERHGKKEYDKYRPYVPRHEVKYSNSLWAIDGSSGKLAYHTTETGKDGKTRSVRRNMYFVRVIDVHSRAVIGWSWGHVEDSKLVKDAIDMAVKASGFIHPKVIISDNGSANTSAEMKVYLKTVAQRVTTITAGNSKGNPAEISVRLISSLGRKFENWFGVGLNAKSIDNTHNPDYMPKNEDLPDTLEVLEQFRELVNDNNNVVMQDGRTRQEWFEQDTNPECIEMDEHTRLRLTGFATEVDMSYRRNVIIVTKNGKDFSFELPNYLENIEEIVENAKNPSEPKVKVYWNTGTDADIYSLDDVFLFTAPKLRKASVIEEEAEEADVLALGHHLKSGKDMDQKLKDFEREIQEGQDALMYLSPSDNELRATYNGAVSDTSLNGKIKDAHNSSAESLKFGVGSVSESSPASEKQTVKVEKRKPKKEKPTQGLTKEEIIARARASL